ncbi:MAG TPA: serine hydrolase [Blastocatellia bacterium]|jgi:CubicO group peptidase (beta-lactamase class C family)
MKLRLVCLLILVALILNACHAASDAAQGQANVAERIQRVENGLLPAVGIKGQSSAMKLAERMAHYKVPGLSVAVVNDGKIEWARGYGVIEKDGDKPVNPDTLFLAGSISKPVAALAALRLVEQGKLDLDEDVNLKLKTWKVPENEFTKAKKVTLRGLLSHSAGMTVHGFPGYEVDAQAATLVQILNGEKPANTPPIRVDVEPGSLWRYSGGGYTVMQQLLIDVTGKSFPELTRELVLAPAGMRRSTYENPLPKSLEASAATAHSWSGDKVKGRWHIYPEMAAAGLWTTPSDLARYVLEVQRALAGQSKILSREMARRMVTVQKGSYGLGPALQNAGKESARFSHGGVDEGFEALFIAYCDRGQGAVAMMNANRAIPLAEELIRAIAKEYNWPDYLQPERALAKVDPAVYQKYAGLYELDDGFKITMTAADGRLWAQGQGQSKFELLPESETNYFSDNGVVHRFELGEGGTVAAVIIEQGGQTRRAKRVK